MMRSQRRTYFFSLIFVVLYSLPLLSFSQTGDQVLDGIGETALSGRYLFKGDLKDWTRNSLHGKAIEALSFEKDARFGSVLDLQQSKNAAISFPGALLSDLNSLSISIWIQLAEQQSGANILSFGKDAEHQLYINRSLSNPGSFEIGLKDGTRAFRLQSKKNEIGKWTHLLVVADMESKKLQLYVDGKLESEEKLAKLDLKTVFGEKSNERQLFINRSFDGKLPSLHARLSDFRVYRVALSADQISVIARPARTQENQTTVNTQRKKDADLPSYDKQQAQLYNKYLTQVFDVQVQTEQGTLPRLPSSIAARYRQPIKLRTVRVIWPAALDNAETKQLGTYTIAGKIPGTTFRPLAHIRVVPARNLVSKAVKVLPVPLSRVQLIANADGTINPFLKNQELFRSGLAKSDPNSFLYMFRHAYGQKQPEGAKPLGGWDTQDTKLRGHATGHYLSAIAQAYAGTAANTSLHQNFEANMNEMVDVLYQLYKLSGTPKSGENTYVENPLLVPIAKGKSAYDSDFSDAGIRQDYWNWGKGYISAYPPDQFIMLEKGAKYGGQKTQIWAPYYTLHKILAGLLAVYEVSGNEKALEMASGMADWVYARLSVLPTETRLKMWNTYIAGEFGGMNETLAKLYQITKKPDHLAAAQLFDNIRVFFGDVNHSHGLAKNVDLFRGLHANQHIPQVVGSIATYNASKKPEYFSIADNFWFKMVNDYMYSIGGVAGARNPNNAECFISEPSTLYENGFSSGGQNETCATYNMLKLTADLFEYEPTAELMDYYERALYNHILASVDENSAGNTYHVPLRAGAEKQFGNAEMDGFTCCNGTALESNTKLQNAIYFKTKANDGIYVNLFIASQLDWEEKAITLTQETDFPKKGYSKISVGGNGTFTVFVRIPGWARSGFQLKINGKVQDLVLTDGKYALLKRTWKNGDVIEVEMPFSFYLDPVMDQPNIASLFYGPILLAAQEQEARKDWRKVNLNATDLGKGISGDRKNLQFSIDGVTFKPFYESFGRHSVYLDVNLTND